MASAQAEDGGVVTYNTVSYEYDTRGNILSKVYSLNGETVDTITYTYGNTVWKDQLTSFDGVSIGYDAIGNPDNWINGETFTWQHGRQLASYAKDGNTISYTYNSDGIRTSKTVGNVKTFYTVIEGVLCRMTDGTNTLQFLDNSVLFNGTQYWYVTNMQGDVVGIIDQNGEYVVQYTYDSWGAPLSITGTMATTFGTLNPFRYRGYIYDAETGLYYCNSRYYDPAVGRFVNADDVAVVTATPDVPHWDKNLYAYCDNNPVMRMDTDGYFWGVIAKAVAVVAVAATVVAATVVTVATFGGGTVAAVAATTAAVTMSAKAFEVGTLQVKKSVSEGKKTTEIITDTIESIYDNGNKIIGFTPAIKTASISTQHYLNSTVAKAFGDSFSIKETLGEPTKGTMAKVFAVANVVIALSTIFCTDPVTWAETRGYSLK